MSRRYRYAEKCLYGYRENEAELERLRVELEELRQSCSVHGQSYGNEYGVSSGHDPVSTYVEQIDRTERRIQHIERRVYPVRRLIADLKEHTRENDHQRLILECFYMEREPVTSILERTHWSRSAFFARRYDLVMRTLGYLLEKDY